MLKTIPNLLRKYGSKRSETILKRKFADIAKPTTTQLCDPECDYDHPKKCQFEQIAAAAFTFNEQNIKLTECRHSHRLSQESGVDLFLKMEVNQVTGSFKERGARWALLQLDEKDRKTGVYAASAGNHALALSYHGQQLGIPVNVVMPRHAPIMKIESCGRFGANIRVEGKHMVESRTIGLRLASENHGKYINGYDHVDVIAGAGTVGLEVIEQMHADVDAVLVPVGGGGLIAGVSLAIKSVFPRVKVIGVEAASCSGFKHSLEAGKPVLSTSLGTLADGLAVPLIGCNSFATAKDHIDRMVTVSEEDISLAILRLVEYEKVVVEGAGAVGIAALLSGQLNDLKGKKVVSLITGGNIDSSSLGKCIERGMVSDHRLMRVELVVSDRPGSLAEMANIIAEQGASLHDINKERTWLKEDMFSSRIRCVIETRNIDHSKNVEDALVKRYGDVIVGTPHQPKHLTEFSKLNSSSSEPKKHASKIRDHEQQSRDRMHNQTNDTKFNTNRSANSDNSQTTLNSTSRNNQS